MKEYIFETSWEVCNRVGGIYTVLSTIAASLVRKFGDNIIYIGPDFHVEDNPFFTEDKQMFSAWRASAQSEGLYVRAGRWNVPGNPVSLLVDFKKLEDRKGEFFYSLWQNYSIDSMNKGQDYDNSLLFSLAAALVADSFTTFNNGDKARTIAHFHEWQTAAGILYFKMKGMPYRTVFTTHATTVGRSICFNQKELYRYFNNYNGDQMSFELGVSSQHSIEKHAALKTNCFTTVSKLTGKECLQLLQKSPDVVTPNGFEAGFVPKGAEYDKKRTQARAALSNVAENLLGYKLDNNALFVGISGRLEYRNKGIDVFIEAMSELNRSSDLNRQVVAFIMVPDWIDGPREDLQAKLKGNGAKYQFNDVYTTHRLHQPQYDSVMQAIPYFQLRNNENDKVKIFFIPSYLNGNDGIFNLPYYDLLVGLDMTIFPSYYEPWGYTPHESAAFSIPTITTDLAGFGLWVSEKEQDITNGVAVLHRDDTNRYDLVQKIKGEVTLFSKLSSSEVEKVRDRAKDIADRGSWNNFSEHYLEAFAFARGEKYQPGAAVVAKADVETKAAESRPVASASTATEQAASKPAASGCRRPSGCKTAKPAAKRGKK